MGPGMHPVMAGSDLTIIWPALMLKREIETEAAG
jgi:hypothetical protein